MPFDGITVRATALELKNIICESRIDKIHMPEKDEVVMIMRNYKGNHRLKISMNSAYPGIYLTNKIKKNPMSPPNFCMFLRKHIGSGIIRDIVTYGYERYLGILVESRNELGDMQHKTLIIELTGRNCNLVLLNASGKILDSFKHVDQEMSRVREVMPARDYMFIPTQNKKSPDDVLSSDILNVKNTTIEKALLNTITGFSPILCREVCHRSSVNPDKNTDFFTDDEKTRFSIALDDMLFNIRKGCFEPSVALNDENLPIDFHSLQLNQYSHIKKFNSTNEALDFYFSNRGEKAHLNLQKSDLVKTISRNIKRCKKKIAIHVGIVEKADSIERFQLMGELITANMHAIKPNSENVELLNYYTGYMIEIKLDPNKNASQNAQRYFKKYKKAKSAITNSHLQLKKSQDELGYLESVEHNLSSAAIPDDITEIRRELVAEGYIKKKHPKYKKKVPELKFRPIKYISSEGYEIYAGRNNIENDYLTFKFANSRDLWLHAKGIPGSHIIIRKKDKREELFPDKTISEAAIIAAYHSRARNSGQVAVDYSEAKNIKKPNNSQPGMVNYFTHYSAYATADEALIESLAVK
ncbi:MAG: NFACT family protein [Clostridiales bacterium]|nr:NFACT family protein [Clostridiales bacterium]